MKKIVFIIILITLVSISSAALALPDLQVYIPDAQYIVSSSDPWLSESWVTDASPFELWVIAANGQINDAFLTLAIPNNGESGKVKLTYITAVPAGFSDPNEFTEFYSKIYDNGQEVKYPPHGVSDSGFLFNELKLGDLAAGSTVKFKVEITEFDIVHFDARGNGLKTNGKPNTFAPFSHDSTYDNKTPEPASLTLLGLGLFGLLGFKRKKR